MRETLFNWLAGRTPGAHCLDLFAGSGALGLEALSRGAAHVTFLEQNAHAARAIEQCLREWDGAHRHDWRVIRSDARPFLAGPAQPFDILFLDPPFDSRLLEQVCERLETAGWLAADARVYIECPAGVRPAVPAAWTGPKAGRAGEVGYHLYSRPRGATAE